MPNLNIRMGPNHLNALVVTSSYRVGQKPGAQRSTQISLAQLSNYMHSFRAGTDGQINISQPGAPSTQSNQEIEGKVEVENAEKIPARRRKR